MIFVGQENLLIIFRSKNMYIYISKQITKSPHKFAEILRKKAYDILRNETKQIFKGPYADHILNPQGSTGSSIFFDTK